MIIVFMLVYAITALGATYALLNYLKMKRLNAGTLKMKEIAHAIRIGSKTFLYQEYRVIVIVVAVVAISLAILTQPSSAFALLLGSFVSGLAGYIGMKASTYANVRVAEIARKTGNISETFKVALCGGSIMGLCVDCFSLFGIVVIGVFFSSQLVLGNVVNWLEISFDSFSMTLISYSLGCSLIAMFSRVAGGIYTKAADVGADLVGKIEEDIPEDDARNPGVIADAVGDNVGDTAGLGADLLESKVASVVAGMVFIIFTYNRSLALGDYIREVLFYKILMYPMIFSAIGLLSCIISLWYILSYSKGSEPENELNKLVLISSVLTATFNACVSYLMFQGEDFKKLKFALGEWSLFSAAVVGILGGVLIGAITRYYTSSEEKPTKEVAEASKEGSPNTIIQGLANGFKSPLGAALVFGMVMIFGYCICGGIGIALAGVGMLSFSATMVSIDTYGPISDNAGGIAEMAGLGSETRKITDLLDSVGNTTAAVGKGFSIGSAAIATVSLLMSYMYSFTPLTEDVVLNIVDPKVLVGAIVGSAAAFYFTGLLIESVSKTAQKMVAEIRRQFREIAGLKDGKAKPDYKSCVKISTIGALSEMKKPALIAIFFPALSGFIFGTQFDGGFQLGATISAIMLAIFCGNAGGSWDNAKKLIESSGLKGTRQHNAAVVGDTVGDPLKDTAGPALNILIKMACTVALILAPIFSKYNLFG